MADNLIKKILKTHLTEPSELIPGEEIFIRVDQTLTHDINAVMTYLAFEQMGIDRCRTECSVSYLDHNLLYMDYKTADDHRYLQSAAKKYGVYVSRPGNGICHVLHTAKFGLPGKILMGGDSHTPHGGAVGMLCIGVGGMDVATAMTGLPMPVKMPEVINVRLTGELQPGCNAKDVILELLCRVGVKGGLGKAFEYTGPGAEKLEVPERATITNMGAETGATTSIFPADEQVRRFFRSQGREKEFFPLGPDTGCEYDGTIEIDLNALEPLCACPHQPDNVMPLGAVERKPVQQVFIGSCTNTSYSDLAKAALVFKGHTVNENVSCTCAVSSRQIYRKLMDDGYLTMLLDAGVRILECACGPCCAIGQTPPTNGVAVRTTNRNFRGRSGNPNAEIYLVGPESAAATAIRGTFASAREIMGEDIRFLKEIKEPDEFPVEDNLFLPPLDAEEAKKVQIEWGPNIKPLPVPEEMDDVLEAKVSLLGGDNISTDDITPASAELSSMRSNIPAMSEYCFMRYDPSFAKRAKALGKSIIVAGNNYGQGSSREHAAINPMYLGVKAVIAKSIARIHRSNLINHGIVPLLFNDPSDYDRIAQGDILRIEGLRSQLWNDCLYLEDLTAGARITLRVELSEKERQVLLSGGRLRYVKRQISDVR